MTEVTFHFNVPDRIAYVCKMLRGVVAKGAKAVVIGDDASIAQLDTALWTFMPQEFVPHCRVDAEPAMRDVTPVLLGSLSCLADELPHHEVLVNLGGEMPLGFERFSRANEIVSLDEDDRRGARLKWKHYSERGYKIVRHDFKAKVAA